MTMNNNTDNIVNDGELLNVSGGIARPRSKPVTQIDYMPNDYAINGITLNEAISMLNERALTSVEDAVLLANAVLYPHSGWSRFHSEGVEYVTRMMFEYHYHNY